jgi:hypothetical protein
MAGLEVAQVERGYGADRTYPVRMQVAHARSFDSARCRVTALLHAWQVHGILRDGGTWTPGDKTGLPRCVMLLTLPQIAQRIMDNKNIIVVVHDSDHFMAVQLPEQYRPASYKKFWFDELPGYVLKLVSSEPSAPCIHA